MTEVSEVTGDALTTGQNNRENPVAKTKRILEESLGNTEIPEKDKERLRILQAELAEENLSKNRRKKLAKEIEWVASRKKRNDQKKQERKTRRKAIQDSDEPKEKRRRMVKMSESACKLRVALDMSLQEYMTEAEITKTVKQVQRCYSLNRRSDMPLQLYLTGLEKADYLKNNTTGFVNWDIHRIEEHHIEHFGKEKVVYLTGDSDNEITELSEDEAYIIGAMVDHNRHKGITHKLATEAGIKHARLPLDKYIDLKTRKVLTIDHCFQILLQRANGVCWKDAILEAIPARKGAQAKDDNESSKSEGEGDEDAQKSPESGSCGEEGND